MNRTTISLALSTMLLIVFAAVAQPIANDPPCAVEVEFHYQGYDGPVHIAGCLTQHTYIGDGLIVKARSLGDGIFRDGFDGEGTP